MTQQGNMSERSKSSTLLDPRSKRFSGNMFSQLRSLASEVEAGIEHLQQELDPSKTKRDNDSHAPAINFLLHTKKDIAQLKCEALAKSADFSMENDKMSRVQELMKRVVAIQAQRLENVESYMEKYGYKRPVFASQEKSSNGSDSIDEDDRNNCVGDKSDTEDDNTSNNYDRDKSPKTPPLEKQSNPSTVRTPRLEDIFKDLSEESIHLIKQSWRCTSQDGHTTKENVCSFSTTNNVTSFPGNTNETKCRTPEQPKLLTKEFAVNNYDHVFERSKQNIQQVETSNFDDIFQRTPEMPKLLTQVFEFGNISKEVNAVSQNSFNGNTDLPVLQSNVADMSHTPEPPALLTGLLTFNNDTGKYETVQSNIVSPSASPETPKLITPGFKLNRFSNRVSGDEPSEPDPQVKITEDMRTPEEPVLLSSRFNPSISSVNPAGRAGRSTRSLFNTPLPMPELTSHTEIWNNIVPDNKDNFQHSVATYLPTHQAPNLLDLDSKNRFGYKGTSYRK